MQVITEGLKPGEQVVIEGMQKLRQGMTVKTTPWQMPPGFNADPSLPAPQPPPADGDYMIEPPEAALEGASAPAEPVVPPPSPSATPAPTPLPEASATPA
jgi:membrane fusion protein (multidrug efflux system)